MHPGSHLILVTHHVIAFCKQWPFMKRNAKPNNNQLSTIYQGVHITYFNYRWPEKKESHRDSHITKSPNKLFAAYFFLIHKIVVSSSHPLNPLLNRSCLPMWTGLLLVFNTMSSMCLWGGEYVCVSVWERERERERFVRMAPRTNFLVQDFLMWMKKNESSLLKM